MIDPAVIEEAVSVGISYYLRSVYNPTNVSIKSISKYSRDESAPASHGVAIEFTDGSRVEVLLVPKA